MRRTLRPYALSPSRWQPKHGHKSLCRHLPITHLIVDGDAVAWGEPLNASNSRTARYSGGRTLSIPDLKRCFLASYAAGSHEPALLPLVQPPRSPTAGDLGGFAEALVEGSLPSLTDICAFMTSISVVDMEAIGRALDRRDMPRLQTLGVGAEIDMETQTSWGAKQDHSPGVI